MGAALALAKFRADSRAHSRFGGQLGHLEHPGHLEQPDPQDDAKAALRNLATTWPQLDALLPDGALSPGVTELSSPSLVASSIAARAIQSAQARHDEAWCAWIDPEGTLYAPGLASAGVDLSRLLVARPPRRDLGRTAVKMALSGAFELLVIDMDAAFETRKDKSPNEQSDKRSKKRSWPSEVLVRKLALAVEDGKTHVLLLTDAAQAGKRVTSWPVGMRLEITRGGDDWSVHRRQRTARS